MPKPAQVAVTQPNAPRDRVYRLTCGNGCPEQFVREPYLFRVVASIPCHACGKKLRLWK